MSIQVNRSFNRTEEDDFKLNVQPRLSDFKEAVPIYHYANGEAVIVGWRIQDQYE
jgi:hypothetical protein